MKNHGLGVKKKLVLFLAVIFLAGCSSTGTQSVSQGATSSDKALTLAWPNDIGPLNPHLYAPSEMFAQSMIYDSLVTYGEDGKIKPSLAESWDISEDGLTYTFHLRPGVKFSDGTSLTADNIIRNFDAIMANKSRHSWIGIMKHIDHVKKVDDLSVRLLLKDYYYPVLQDLSFVRPFRFLGEAGFPADGKTSETIVKPVGTGPWALKEYKKDEYAVFKRNEHYWGQKPKLEQITVKIIPDQESIVLAFEKGDIDLIYGRGVISRDSFLHLKESGKYGVSLSDGLTTRAIILNTLKGATSELPVRQAIQYAIDKASMIESVTKGTELNAETALGRNIPYANLDLKPIEYDPAKAGNLLDEAGWIIDPSSGVRMKDGKPLVLKFVYISTEAVQKQMAEVIQGDLAKVGIKVEIQGVEVMLGLQMLKSGEANMNFWSSYGAPNDPHNFVTVIANPTADGIFEAFSNLPQKQEMDQEINKVLISKDEEERRSMYADILFQIHEEAVFYPISYEANIALYQKKWIGVEPTASKYKFPFESIDLRP
ncbi:nickel ABC transporter substrate-binding protein [Paenibacillus sp. FSL W7-1279]|uniref:nickel ABC transporter substrate-binding protein n=1 Tax=unclassified Paenibacillus TaxID=185978 RepID=UPI0030D0CA0A